MPSVLVVRDDARRELLEARDYYDEQRPGYGELFVEALEAEFDLLLEFPNADKAVRRGVRRLTMRRWPYSIFYRIDGEEIAIVAVAHHRRHPGYWKRRLR